MPIHSRKNLSPAVLKPLSNLIKHLSGFHPDDILISGFCIEKMPDLGWQVVTRRNSLVKFLSDIERFRFIVAFI